MKTPEFKMSQKEEQTGYRIEHLSGVDVVINLDYQSQEDCDFILKILKQEIEQKNKTMFSSLREINRISDEKMAQRFYVKYKKGADPENVDFVLGRNNNKDYLSSFARGDFDKKARYAYAGVLNEIMLSKKIKELVASSMFQELAKKYGFTSFIFSEPLIAVVDKEAREKYLVYKYINENSSSHSLFPWDKIVQDLIKLFIKNGITPHDLRKSQFLVTSDNCLVLIDTEAYVEEKN